MNTATSPQYIADFVTGRTFAVGQDVVRIDLKLDPVSDRYRLASLPIAGRWSAGGWVPQESDDLGFAISACHPQTSPLRPAYVAQTIFMELRYSGVVDRHLRVGDLLVASRSQLRQIESEHSDILSRDPESSDDSNVLRRHSVLSSTLSLSLEQLARLAHTTEITELFDPQFELNLQQFLRKLGWRAEGPRSNPSLDTIPLQELGDRFASSVDFLRGLEWLGRVVAPSVLLRNPSNLRIHRDFLEANLRSHVTAADGTINAPECRFVVEHLRSIGTRLSADLEQQERSPSF